MYWGWPSDGNLLGQKKDTVRAYLPIAQPNLSLILFCRVEIFIDCHNEKINVINGLRGKIQSTEIIR